MHHADAERNRVVRATNVAHLAVYQNLAAVGRIKTVSNAHHRRLPGAVLADNGVNRSRCHTNVDSLVGEHVAKTFRDVAKFDHLSVVSCQLSVVSWSQLTRAFSQ